MIMIRQQFVRPKYALIVRPSSEYPWIVASSFPDLESCEKGRSMLEKLESACVPINDPRVQDYYRRVNEERRKYRLKPLRPDEPIVWPVE